MPNEIWNNVSHTQGRCKTCNIRFVWKKGKPRLQDAACPRCFKPLTQTTHLFKKGPTVFQQPIEQIRAKKGLK